MVQRILYVIEITQKQWLLIHMISIRPLIKVIANYMRYKGKRQYLRIFTSSATTVLSSITRHTYRGQTIVFMNIYEAEETHLFPMKWHVTIKYLQSQ